MSKVNSEIGALRADIVGNSLQIEQLSEDVRNLMYAIRDLTELAEQESQRKELKAQRKEQITRANATANARMTMGQSGG